MHVTYVICSLKYKVNSFLRTFYLWWETGQNTPKSHSAFPWISAQPLLKPLLNMHTTIHEINALREVLWQRVGKFLLKSIITLSDIFHRPTKLQSSKVWLSGRVWNSHCHNCGLLPGSFHSRAHPNRHPLTVVDKSVPGYDYCCGQLWVWHIVCGQTCDGLYHFTLDLIISGYQSDPSRSSQP